MAVVEVLHYRNPDVGCTMLVFLDGAMVSFCEVTIDPGAGYSRSDWDDHRAESLDRLSPNAQEVATRWFDSAEESKYIGR